MTNPVEAMICDLAQNTEGPSVAVAEVPPVRLGLDAVDFLDAAWAEEFDRRLAAWEAESPSPGPEIEATVRR